MSDREAILARIREALTVPAPKLKGHPGEDHAEPASVSGPASAGVRRWLPAVGASFEDQMALFRANSTELKTNFELLSAPEEVAARLCQMRDAEGWKRIGSHAGAWTTAACEALALPVCRTDAKYDAQELEGCEAGVTECDALIAQTGSVLVTSRSAGGRALSVLPPHHVVLARREQLLPDLTAAFQLVQRKYASGYPSFVSLITGPSRTGDIERILVLGAHGPRKLTILCW
jgi:L-lactate dehydrogenase complex protein LldG